MSKAKRKIFSGIICIACVFSLGFGAVSIHNFRQDTKPESTETVADSLPVEKQNIKINAKAGVLMDADTGQVVFEQNGHEELPFASVTKIMTMLLAVEAVESGKASLDDQVSVSEYAASMGGSQMYLEMGETHTLEELLEGIAIVSANDACVAVSEYIAGSEEVFVEKMNNRAKELGMRDTNFVNTNGLPAQGHVSSAYDIGVMGCELLKYEKARQWISTWQKDVRIGLPGKEKDFTLSSTNKMLKQYRGANGIKTGFTEDAGFCLCASATRDDTSLVAVVLGADTSKSRNAEVAKLLDYGFANYESKLIADKGKVIKTLSLEKGEPEIINVVTGEKASVFIEKGTGENIKEKIVTDVNIEVPLEKGDKVGTLEIYNGEEKIKEVPLISDQEVEKVSVFTYCGRKIKSFLPRKEKK